jgi:hypothetical protein
MHAEPSIITRKCRLERHAKIDRFPVGNSALNTTAAIGRRADFALFHPEWIIVLGAGHENAAKARADLKSFGRRQTEHRFAKIGFQAVEHRFAPARRHAARDTFDDPADAIALDSRRLDQVNHLLGGDWIGAADNVPVRTASAR